MCSLSSKKVVLKNNVPLFNGFSNPERTAQRWKKAQVESNPLHLFPFRNAHSLVLDEGRWLRGSFSLFFCPYTMKILYFIEFLSLAMKRTVFYSFWRCFLFLVVDCCCSHSRVWVAQSMGGSFANFHPIPILPILSSRTCIIFYEKVLEQKKKKSCSILPGYAIFLFVRRVLIICMKPSLRQHPSWWSF